jgi:Asp-tRNA(Asn)/Glu-tRNA(Gln) amidotransferase A subunit family amidase
MVPGAVGSQTNGSVIRPASFCGVVGFKPTHGLIPRTGVLLTSRALDHVGVFARSVEDAALLTESLIGYDEEDPDTRPVARLPLAATARSAPPLPPRFAFVKSPVWDQAEPSTQEAFAELVAALGDQATEVDLPSSFAGAVDAHRIVMEAEMAHNLRRDYEKFRDQLSEGLRSLIERGRGHKAVDYAAALAGAEVLNRSLDELFNEYDAILTPATPGEAPMAETTGSPIFDTIWTYLGTPAVTVPLLQSENGLPVGVQLVARRGHDARLLRTAQTLVNNITGQTRRRGKKAAGR